MKLNKPKTQVQEVLYMLLTRKTINTKQMVLDCNILNLTARISDLRIRHDIDVKCDKIVSKNKFKRQIEYGLFSLVNKNHAKSVYDSLNG